MKLFRDWIWAAFAVLAGLCVAFVSALPAQAETTDFLSIADLRAQCADGWHQTYEAHGRTVTVDIPVQVPSAEAFPVLQADRMPAAAELKVTKAAYGTIGDAEYANQDGSFLYQSPSANAYQTAAKKTKPAQMPKGYTGYPIIRRLNALELDTPYAVNNDTTVRQSQALLEKTWRRFFPNEPLELIPSWAYAYSSCRKYNGNADTYGDEVWTDFEGPLMAHFNQCLNGIPLLSYAAESYRQLSGKSYRAEEGLNADIVAISQSYQSVGLGMFYSLQYAVVRQTGVLCEDVPLCSFDKVKQTCEGLIADGVLRRVDTLRLGYVIWLQKDGTFVLTPAWVLEGELFPNAEATAKLPPKSYDSDSLEYGKLLINAQNGEWIDPWNTDKERSYQAPSVIAWSDVQ